MFEVTNVDVQVHRMKGEDLAQSAAVRDGKAEFSWDGAHAVLGIEQTEEGTIGKLDLHIDQQSCEPNNNLAFDKPVCLSLHTNVVPRAVTALYLFGDWWTRPAFCSDFSTVPERTQVALIDTGDGFLCFVPMVGSEFKAVMGPGGTDWVSLSLTAGRDAQSSVHEPLFVCTEADTIYEAIRRAFAFLARERNIPQRCGRRYPEIFEYLGWCSWDAFYRDVDAQGIRDKARELREKNVPIRWMLIDDGWLSTKDDMLWDYAPDPEKFDGDLTGLVRDIKDSTDVRWIGVWRALSGYWAGVHPEGPLARFSREDLLFAGNGRVVPRPETDRAFRFSDTWHRLLRSFGVDFVKVDVQGAVKNHYEGSASMCAATKGLLEGLDASTCWFDGAQINCMGMAMEDILSRPSSAISRNSDDFLPRKEESFSEHLLQNAYNALYHGQMYWCDWDMFWTTHPHAAKHALLRAISGGPVYCSDRVGETDPGVLRPLAYEDGRILRMARPAVPMSENVFQDPQKVGVLMLSNVTSSGLGAVAAFNLADSAQCAFFMPREISGIAASERYAVWDWRGQTLLRVCAADEAVECAAEENNYRLFLVVPWSGGAACLGRTDKYMGIAAVEAVYPAADGQIIELAEQGPTAFLTNRRIERLRCNGDDAMHLLTVEPCDAPDGTYVSILRLPVRPERAVLRVTLSRT